MHFGPQASGESGDWYARKMYVQGTRAYDNHLKKYGHPSAYGYKEVLRDWNPKQLNPAKLARIYQDAGARFLMIQGVHHDNFDLWDSQYQPWNSVNIGPKRDIIGEWAKAARAAGIKFGVTFHHEYTWWWWQTAFGSDTSGVKKGVPYDGHLTLADGKGKWWQGLDPRLLYGIDLREYKGVERAAKSPWSPPPAGIFSRHLAYDNGMRPTGHCA
ncbi:alpha-L-fucosidase [Mucilaginibacter sp. P25]|uniref:alpha-L-fucosidase n=1 Tax=Mucilaginibacter sp. P25 TaxID=3423945 RepID=UPI003D7B7976